MALGFASCSNKDEDYMVFVGTWGVKQIDYYNTDYWGNPIENTRETYHFTPGDTVNGIDLIFKSNRSGEMRDRSRDTLYIPVYEDGQIVDTNTIVCPDTILVTKFTYSYHKDDGILYMNMKVSHPFTYMMKVPTITNESFTYINEYDNNYVEEALLARISDDARNGKASRVKPVFRPRRKGSLLSAY